MLGKKRLLAAFLEKDNIKLLVYEVFFGEAKRVFAGQITFSPEVLRDAFISDAVKFDNQVKIALGQKEALTDVSEVALFIPPDKTFTKSQAASDSVDAFVQGLPYFREELVISTEPVVGKQLADKVTYVAFEKKLVEDLERPFLEAGKKVVAVKSGINCLVSRQIGLGEYFILVPFEKEVAVAAVAFGAIGALASFGKNVFPTRFSEFVANHNLGTIREAYVVGPFDETLAVKVGASGITVSSLVSGDVYDLVVAAYVAGQGRMIEIPRPQARLLFLTGAIVAGVLLVGLLVKGAGRIGFRPGLPTGVKSPVGSAVPGPTGQASPSGQAAVEAKPADFKVRVLNGTLVEGEAGRLATKLGGLGFAVVETKNATSAGFVATRLRSAADVPDKLLGIVKTALTDTYDSLALEPLASDSAGVKIEIIIGKKK